MVVHLQLPMQSVPITTKLVSSNPTHGEVYSIQHYVIKGFLATCDRSVVFFGYSGFLNQYNWQVSSNPTLARCTRYNVMWQILSHEFVSSAPRTTDLNWTQIFSAGLRVMVFNATFNNISAISWWSVLLVYPEKTTDMPQGTDKLYHIML
jgi:hypothetical protein